MYHKIVQVLYPNMTNSLARAETSPKRKLSPCIFRIIRKQLRSFSLLMLRHFIQLFVLLCSLSGWRKSSLRDKTWRMEIPYIVSTFEIRRGQAEPLLRVLFDVPSQTGSLHRRDRRSSTALSLFYRLPGW